jgi:hypothetical protein
VIDFKFLKTVGREIQTKTLLAAFERVTDSRPCSRRGKTGRKLMFLLAGNSGKLESHGWYKKFTQPPSKSRAISSPDNLTGVAKILQCCKSLSRIAPTNL